MGFLEISNRLKEARRPLGISQTSTDYLLRLEVLYGQKIVGALAVDDDHSESIGKIAKSLNIDTETTSYVVQLLSDSGLVSVSASSEGLSDETVVSLTAEGQSTA